MLKKGKLRRLNILEGSVRSGKTYVSLILWGFWAAEMPAASVFLMCGKTLVSLKRNVLEPMQRLFGEEDFYYSLSKKEGRLFGHTVYLESANDARSEGKIRGMSLDGAYCDELTLFGEEFFSMLLSRLSGRGAKLIATTNPDHPYHWLKKRYLEDGELDLLDLKFSIDDNIFLEKSYVEALKKEYKGVYYDRFIKGEWVAAEGRIYTDFGKAQQLSPAEIEKRLERDGTAFETIGVDFGGNRSASAFIHVAFDSGFNNVYVTDELHDALNKSAESLIESFKQKSQEWNRRGKIRAAFCDSAEQLLVKSFRNAAKIDVRNAEKKPINTRISMLCRLMAAGRFYVSTSCPHLIEALDTAVWDPGKAGTDSRLDNGTTDIDSLDALEYAFERYDRELFRL